MCTRGRYRDFRREPLVRSGGLRPFVDEEVVYYEFLTTKAPDVPDQFQIDEHPALRPRG
ncbi:MAG: hypothetical protein ACLVJK_12325 [Alistipes putredinis]